MSSAAPAVAPTRIQLFATRPLAAGLILVAVWLPPLGRLTRLWRSEPDQYFGFAVPVLVAWLLWQRRAEWTRDTRPAVPSAPDRAACRAIPGALAYAVGLLALESNPLWPMAAWLASLGAVALSLGALARLLGPASLRAAAPVLLMLLTALKWPTAINAPLMSALMHGNARVASELVSIAGEPAVVGGTVIETARGYVGVDEACSGLRSLQTVVMMALFLGEFGRLAPRRRLLLLGGAVGAALLFNLARTTTLTWLFSRHGPALEDEWHDPVGAIALALTLGAVWWLSERLPGRGAPALPDERAPADTPRSGSPWKPVALVAAIVVAAEGGVQAWYLAHTPADAARVSWHLYPRDGDTWREVEVSRRAADMLRYSEHESLARETSEPSRQYLAYSFRWEADLARLGIPELHDPLICLPSIGATLERELPPAEIEVEGVPISFRFVRFRQGTTPQHVWFTLWSTRPHADGLRRLSGVSPTAERWARVRDGIRGDEREQLIFFLQGEPDDTRAADLLRTAVHELLRRR